MLTLRRYSYNNCITLPAALCTHIGKVSRVENSAHKLSFCFCGDNPVSENVINITLTVCRLNQQIYSDSRKNSDVSDWTIAIGKHKGIISSEDWITVQTIIEGNAEKKLGFRQTHNSDALLSGVLRCKCGSYMRPKYQRVNKKGERPFSYMCELKEKSHKAQCSCNNVNGRHIDKLVCEVLLDYERDGSIFSQYVGQIADIGEKNESIDKLIKTQYALIAKNEKAISNLLIMATESESITVDYINKEIAKHHVEIENAKNEIKRLERLKKSGETLSDTVKSTEEQLRTFKENFANMSNDNKRDFIRRCVSKVEWDEDNISVFFLDR